MKLVVSSNQSLEEDFDTMRMEPIEFNHLHAHPYIATAGFSEVQLDLNDDINPAYVSYLAKATWIRPIYKDFNLSANAILILSYVYTDRAAALRYFNLSDKEKLHSLLEELAKTYEWRKID